MGSDYEKVLAKDPDAHFPWKTSGHVEVCYCCQRHDTLKQDLAEAEAIIAGDPPAEVADYLRSQKESDQAMLALIEAQGKRVAQLQQHLAETEAELLKAQAEVASLRGLLELEPRNEIDAKALLGLADKMEAAISRCYEHNEDLGGAADAYKAVRGK